jgi:type I restriction-modification system DNA methylase subunit
MSTMIGKTKEDRTIKKEILKNHTLEGVLSLNKNTFYRVGTVPCIAVFKAGKKHPTDKLVKFINFEDDGFEVRQHLGLVETERAKDRKSYMLSCWRGEAEDAPSKFLVQTTVEDTDEWIHSFYYFNDEIPSEQDFTKTIADYLTFEFSMIVHGKGHLLRKAGEKNA